jgi:hydrogenase maturation protein HypF
MKSAPALAARGEALLGPHVGDLDSPAARDRHAEVTRRLLALYRVRPHGVVHDAHPDYATTLAATDCGCYRLEVQHHHAHALASLAGDAAPGPVLAVTWDGTGLGEHGQLWGGEWLEVEAAVARRVAWLRPLPLPGGEAAIREPWRIAIALLREAGLEPDALTMPGVSDAEARRIARLCDAAGLVSRTSSAGRWLDGLSAVAGLCSEASFDGEAAMRLEGSLPPGWAVSPPVCTKPLQVERTATGLELDWRPFLVHVVTQLRQGADAATVASLAHAALVEAIVAVARARRARTVVLTGGCFQNRSLVEAAALRLAQAGIDVITPGRVPPNDGGLALGQVLAAVRRLATAPMDAA